MEPYQQKIKNTKYKNLYFFFLIKKYNIGKKIISKKNNIHSVLINK